MKEWEDSIKARFVQYYPACKDYSIRVTYTEGAFILSVDGKFDCSFLYRPDTRDFETIAYCAMM